MARLFALELTPNGCSRGLLPGSGRNRPRDTDPDTWAREAEVVGAAVGCARPNRRVEPGTAANDPVTAVACYPRRAIRRRSIVVAMPAILHPFINIAEHVVEAKFVGSK